jgi:DNA-binding NarL/FixJ family response regulator
MRRVELSTRQAQVVELVARGKPDKVIAAELQISIDTVRFHIKSAAARIPGDSSPRHRLTLFFLDVSDEKRAG